MSNQANSPDGRTKAAAALRVLGGEPAEQSASELGVSPEQVLQWVEYLRKSAPEVFEQAGDDGPAIGQYRSLLDSITRNVQEAVLRSTPGEGLVFVNDAFLKMFGYDSKEEAMNTRPEQFYADHEERWKLVQELTKTGRISNAEVQFRRRDGTGFWGLENSILVKTEEQVYIDAIVHDITERKQFEDRIRASLREKEVLLGEIHHRVKNNLAVISGLLYLQEERSDDPGARNLLRQSRSRINSMAIVHEMLYRNRTFSSIEPAQCVEELVDYIRSNLEVPTNDIRLNVEPGDLQLDMNTAVPCALILHELLSNAFKYAFPEGTSGKVAVRFEKSEGRHRMTVEDNGIGIPDEVLKDLEGGPSLGLFLVQTLVKQLNGDIKVAVDGGTRFEIMFPD